MTDTKFSAFPDADNSGPITGVGLQGGANVKFPGPGVILLGAAAISAPIAKIQASIPASVGSIVVTLEGITGTKDGDPSVSVSLGLQVSFDGGLTFVGDADAYLTQGGDLRASGWALYGGYSTDLSVDIGGWGPAPGGGAQAYVGYSGVMNIFPGDGTRAFNVNSKSNTILPGTANEFITLVNGTMNLQSSSPSVADFQNRITDICIEFYRSAWGDSHINSGFYSIQGLLSAPSP